MVRSERTTVRFFHQRLCESAQTLQERLALRRAERGKRSLERPVPPRQPGTHAFRRERVQLDDGAPAVVDMLAPSHESVVLELSSQLAGGGQGQPELACDLPHRSRPLSADMGEHRDMTRAEAPIASDQLQQLRRWPAAAPEPAQHRAQ
jgi:hypothetical protein